MNLSKKSYLHIGCLVSVTALLYTRSLSNEFLFHWDDQWVAINIYTEQGFSAHNLWLVLTDFYHGQYAPLNELLYIIVFSLFGYNPVAFHAASILLHVCNVVLVYLFISALLQGMVRGGTADYSISKQRCIAFVTALLFAVSPVCVEAVSWVSASKVLVYSFYYLIALCLYLKYVETGSRTVYLLVLLFFILSFGGKEQAVVFFLCCLLTDYATGRKDAMTDILLEKIPMILLALFFGCITIMSQGAGGPDSGAQYGMCERCLLACYSLFEYIVKAFLPFNLSYIYPFPFLPGEHVPLHMFLYPLAVAALAYTVYSYRKNRLVVFASLYFLVHLLVALHIISISRFAVTADRYAYLSLVASCLIVSILFVKLAQGRTRVIAGIALCLYISYLGAYTFNYQKQWKNSTTLKHHIREILKTRQDLNPPAKEIISVGRVSDTQTNNQDYETE